MPQAELIVTLSGSLAGLTRLCGCATQPQYSPPPRGTFGSGGAGEEGPAPHALDERVLAARKSLRVGLEVKELRGVQDLRAV
jgi:hypothetical protein